MNDQNAAGLMAVVAALGVGLVIFCIAVAVLVLVGGWMMFTKAGKPGWAIIIPFYNIIVLLDIVGKPAWWIILFLIPVVSLVVGIIVAIELAKCFGKGTGFAIGLVLLPFIFYPILGFGSAEYSKPAAAA